MNKRGRKQDQGNFGVRPLGEIAKELGITILWTDDFRENLVGYVTGAGAYVIFMLGRYSR
jgi:hypothetical protein